MIRADMLKVYKEKFLEAFPECKFFDTPRYLKQERAYKEELVGYFQESVLASLKKPIAATEIGELAETIISPLTHPLKIDDNKPQNLVGWRYFTFLKALNPDNQLKFVNSVGDLINAPANLTDRCTSFFDAITEIHLEETGKRAIPALLRSLTSFYLFLAQPQTHPFIKTREFKSAVLELTGEKLPDTPDQFQRVQDLVQEIYDLLTTDGWSPRDMIDIQTFIWVKRNYEVPSAENIEHKLIKVLAEKKLNVGETAARNRWELLKTFDGKAVSRFYERARIEMRDSPEQFQQGDWWSRELNWCLDKDYIELIDAATIEEPKTFDVVKPISIAMNQILYGPPGTGKTYATITKALEILDPEFLHLNRQNREVLKARYDELKTEGRIEFVTFHQSFSYEDFVEGLRASTTDENDISYEVEEGVFKSFCDDARARVTHTSDSTFDPNVAKIWKMSLGDKGGLAETVVPECIENNYVAIGWSGTSFQECGNPDQIQKRLLDSGFQGENVGYAVRSLDSFVNKMQIGDIILVSEGNLRLKGIAQVAGDYEYKETDVHGYFNRRAVKWLRVFDPAISYERVMNKRFVQLTLYELKEPIVNVAKLSSLVSDNVLSDSTKPYVLIIDEINRGNIANIFGELITLIEPSKRADSAETLTVTLPYSKQPFSVPSNLFLLGTMNTADRSLVHLDTALRRRFKFEEMMPDMSLLADIKIEGVDVARMVETMNKRIEILYDREHTLGHSFFMPLKETPTISRLAETLETAIFPLLEEYFFEDWSRIRQVLGDNLKRERGTQFFIEKYSEA